MSTPTDRYQAENLRRITIKVNAKLEPDLLKHIESQPNIQGYILNLIREDMKK